MSLDRSPELCHEVWIRQVHAVLQRLFRQAGRGSMKRVEAALEIAEGSFRQWRRRGKLPLEMLFKTLDELGVTPGSFWVEVLGSDLDPVQVAKRPSGPPRDPVVRRAIARWEKTSLTDDETMTEDRLAWLDGLRHEDPKVAVRRAKEALTVAGSEWLPQLLAVYGSARRAEAKIEGALEALRYALLLAESAGTGSVVCADILQRIGAAYAFTGNHGLGLLFAKQATYEHRLAGNDRGEGRSWVDQGARYVGLARFENAFLMYATALRCLPEDEIRNRFAAHHGSAVALRNLGKRSAAESAVLQAQSLAPQLGEEAAAFLEATRADFAFSDQDFAKAERSLTAAIRVYKRLSPLDAALASIELVRAQILGGRIPAARQTIQDMAALLKPLRRNPLARDAIHQLIRLALVGEQITLRLLDQLSRQIKPELRARHDATPADYA